MSRSILAKAIYELWGSGTTYPDLHASVRSRSAAKWSLYQTATWKFFLDTYNVTRTDAEQRSIIDSFSYLGFRGSIRMRDAEQEFGVFEDYEFRFLARRGERAPRTLYFGRLVGRSARDLVTRYSLKTRKYISTTSMDSELALVTANLALAAPGKLFYDPFIGTGSFPIACAHFGVVALGSDIDGRPLRGKEGRNVVSSFEQYHLSGKYLDGFISDLTHTPLRSTRGWLDGIVCDPPYGVREGLKVLGSRDGGGKEVVWIDGEQAHLYSPPKRL
jgi:tRNA (guanine10-N2)-methyltransferase